MELLTYFFTGDEWTSLQRLVIALILGAVVGFERERSGKVAGLRTHALVSVGAALFTVISILIYEKFPSTSGVSGYDGRIVSNILVGIGFVGGGAILRTGTKVQGITTAATLWVTAAIGTAAGFGFYREALSTTILAYFILTVFWWLEKKFGHDIWYQNLNQEERTHAHVDNHAEE